MKGSGKVAESGNRLGKRFPHHLFPVQRGIQAARGEEPVDLVHSHVAAPLNVFEGQLHGAICVVEFFSTFSRCPFGTEAGKDSTNFVAIYAIAAFIGTPAGSEFDFAPRDGMSNDDGKLADPVVLVRTPHVENLIMDKFARSVQDTYDSGDNIS